MAAGDQFRPSRRNFIRSSAAVAGAAGIAGVAPAAAGATPPFDPPGPPFDPPGPPLEPPRGGRERTMTDVPYEGFEEVRVGLIGLGNRGGGQDLRFAAVSKVTAVADIRPERVTR